MSSAYVYNMTIVLFIHKSAGGVKIDTAAYIWIFTAEIYVPSHSSFALESMPVQLLLQTNRLSESCV